MERNIIFEYPSSDWRYEHTTDLELLEALDGNLRTVLKMVVPGTLPAPLLNLIAYHTTELLKREQENKND
jgi:hypothetical protein